ncbi:hypothetical protein [Microbaculum marinum]|uniref:Uncharacterized protein n=1 Tax=Microbaculum marinum TaxID=1764581 RepID=A0AAW9RNL0_9HYPH
MATSRMHAADFWASICFFIVGVYMAVSGLGMPGAGGFIEDGGEPGRVPILLGVVIALLALTLLVRSALAGGFRPSAIRTEDPAERAGLWRCGVTAAGCSVYAVGLVGARIGGWHVPYDAATALFVFLFVVIAEWPLATEHGARRWQRLSERWPGIAAVVAGIGAPLPAAWRPRAWLVVNAALMAVIVSALVTIVFERYFFVALP